MLGYESRRPGALEPGEVVLWEHQVPAKGRRRPSILYLVTQRRAVSFQDGPEPQAHAVTLAEVRRVQFDTRDHRRLSLRLLGDGYVQFERLTEWREPFRLVAMAAAVRAGRGRPVRRGGPRPPDEMTVNSSVMTTDPPTPGPESIDPLEPDLLPGERLLWSGRPLPREPFDRAKVLQIAKRIAWLLIPAVILFFGMTQESWERVPQLVVLIAGVWLAIGLWRLLISPHVQARHRANTRYVLTNFRAIVISRDRKRRSLRSEFLDMAEGVFIEERLDGIGSVGCGHGTLFELIPQAREVHGRLVRAIRDAGGDPTRSAKVDDLDLEDQL